MPKTFLLTSAHNQQLSISQAHINVWLFTTNRVFVDVGFQLLVNVALFTAQQSLLFSFYTPFCINLKTLSDLFPKLLNDDIRQLVFNMDSKTRTNVSLGGNNGPFIEEFQQTDKILFTGVQLTADNTNDHKLSINIPLGNVDKTAVTTQITVGQIPIYVRFRYQVNTGRFHYSNLYHQRRFFHDQVHLDFRFNEPRTLSALDPAVLTEMVSIDKTSVFVISPIHFKLHLEPASQREYIRLLEKDRQGWFDYIPNLRKQRNEFLVYQWKAQLPTPNGHFDMLVAFEAEKGDILGQLAMVVLLLISGILFLNLPTFLGPVLAIEEVKEVVDNVIEFIGIVLLAIATGVAGNAIWQFIWQWWKTRR